MRYESAQEPNPMKPEGFLSFILQLHRNQVRRSWFCKALSIHNYSELGTCRWSSFEDGELTAIA